MYVIFSLQDHHLYTQIFYLFFSFYSTRKSFNPYLIIFLHVKNNLSYYLLLHNMLYIFIPKNEGNKTKFSTHL